MEVESSQSLAIQAYDHYQNGDYDSALVKMQKVKNLKQQQNDQQYIRVQENILFCQYSNKDGRMNDSQLLSKLHELIQEVLKIKEKEKLQQATTKSNKKNTGKQGTNEDDLSMNSKKEDDTILRYNYSVILLNIGKFTQAFDVLLKLYVEKKTQDNFIMTKVKLLLMELALQQKHFLLLIQILNSFNTSKLQKDSKEQKETKKHKCYYVSVIFGNQIHSMEYPENICKYEQQFYLGMIKAQLSAQLGDNKLARKHIKQSQKYLIKFVNVLTSNKNNEIPTTFHPKLASIIHLHALSLFNYTKAQVAYYEQNFQKVFKLISPTCVQDAQLLSNPDEYYKYFQIYQVFQLNNIGCAHLKMKKSSMAVLYFNKAISLASSICNKANGKNIQQFPNHQRQVHLVEKNILSKMNHLYYNLGLALYEMKKYEKAYYYLNQASEQRTSSYSIWYRLGEIQLSQYHETLSNNFTNSECGIYMDQFDTQDIKYAYQTDVHQVMRKNSKTHSKDDNTHDDHAKNYFKRYSLCNKDKVICLSNDNDSDEARIQEYQRNKPQNKIYYIDKALQEKLDMSLKCFKNCLHLLQSQIEKIQNQLKSDTKYFIYIDSDKKTSSNEDLTEQQFLNLKDSLFQQRFRIYQSLLTYIAYIHLCKQEYNQALQYSQKAYKLDYITPQNKSCCLNYQIECYMNLNQTEEAVKLINSDNSFLDSVNITHRNTAGVNKSDISVFNAAISFALNTVAYYLKNNETTKAQTSLNTVLSKLNIQLNSPQAQIPTIILNLLIYLNLQQNNIQQALTLVKRRRLLSNVSENKQLLKITKQSYLNYVHTV